MTKKPIKKPIKNRVEKAAPEPSVQERLLAYHMQQVIDLCITSEGANLILCRGCGMLGAQGRHKSTCPVGRAQNAIRFCA